jgi:hypothetical protein
MKASCGISGASERSCPWCVGDPTVEEKSHSIFADKVLESLLFACDSLYAFNGESLSVQAPSARSLFCKLFLLLRRVQTRSASSATSGDRICFAFLISIFEFLISSFDSLISIFKRSLHRIQICGVDGL